MMTYIAHKEIDPTVCTLDGVQFYDSGGTNGWLANPLPVWMDEFVRGLNLPGKIVKVVLRQLPAGQGIPLHTDLRRYDYPGVHERRWHVPIVTHPFVQMAWPDSQTLVHLEAGYLYEVNHFEPHEILNHAPVARVHLCIDTVEYERAAA